MEEAVAARSNGLRTALAPPGIMPHPVQGSAAQVSGGSNCDYQVTLPNTSAGPTDPITYNYFGTVDQFLDTPEEWAVPNDYGSICYTTWDVGNEPLRVS